MKPTAALTDRGTPATSSAKAPPVRANGTVSRMARALRPEFIAAYRRPRTASTASGTTILSRASARCWFSNSPPHVK